MSRLLLSHSDGFVIALRRRGSDVFSFGSLVVAVVGLTGSFLARCERSRRNLAFSPEPVELVERSNDSPH